MKCVDGSWDYVAVCTPGLTKNGTNITIIIKDTVKVYIDSFLYTGPDTNASKVTLEVNTEKDVEDYNQVDDGTVNPLDYDISEDDWRMGRPQISNTNNTANNTSGIMNEINVNIYNSSIIVNSSDKINFKDMT